MYASARSKYKNSLMKFLLWIAIELDNDQQQQIGLPEHA
jgi:hypothetical protein